MTAVATAPAAPATPTPGYRWPAGIPSWEETALTQLSAQGALGTVPPQVLGGIAKVESAYGATGVSVNPQGFGGYFGEQATQSYPGGTATRTLLQTPSPQSFATQATIAASALGSFGHTPVGDLNEYQTGTPSAPSLEGTVFVHTVAPKGATLTGFNPWMPWTWAGSAASAAGHAIGKAAGGAVSPLVAPIEHYGAEILFVGAGAVLVIFGLYKAAGSPGQKAATDVGHAAAAGALA